MLSFSHWFWSVLSFIYAALWLWILLPQQRRKKKILPLVSTDQNYIEAEDGLKAAYHLHDKKKDWDSKDLSLIIGITDNLTEGLIDVFIDFNWAEKDRKDKRDKKESDVVLIVFYCRIKVMA